MNHTSFVVTQLNGFKYCYPTLIILFNTNHLFVLSSNGFKYCYLSATDLQPLTSCICKVMIGLGTCLPQEQFEEYGQDNLIGSRA